MPHDTPSAPTHAPHWETSVYPLIITVGLVVFLPLAFLVTMVVSLLDNSHQATEERARFDDQFVRAQTGVGAAAASNH